jgi:hypothetical protein
VMAVFRKSRTAIRRAKSGPRTVVSDVCIFASLGHRCWRCGIALSNNAFADISLFLGCAPVNRFGDKMTTKGEKIASRFGGQGW